MTQRDSPPSKKLGIVVAVAFIAGALFSLALSLYFLRLEGAQLANVIETRITELGGPVAGVVAEALSRTDTFTELADGAAQRRARHLLITALVSVGVGGVIGAVTSWRTRSSST